MRQDKLERAEIQTLNSVREGYPVSPPFKLLGGQFWLKGVWRKKCALILRNWDAISSALDCGDLTWQPLMPSTPTTSGMGETTGKKQ